MNMISKLFIIQNIYQYCFNVLLVLLRFFLIVELFLFLCLLPPLSPATLESQLPTDTLASAIVVSPSWMVLLATLSPIPAD